MEQHAVLKELKELTVQTGVTQTSVAKRLGITPAYLSRIIAGECAPSDELMTKVNELVEKLKQSGLVAG